MIVAVPYDKAVSIPLSSTVTTSGFEDSHTTDRFVAFEGRSSRPPHLYITFYIEKCSYARFN